MLLFRASALFLLFGICLVALTIVQGCKGDSPTGSRDARDYAVYFWDANSADTYWRYWVKDQTIDTFVLPYEPEKRMVVSQDQKTLYIPQVTSVVAVSTADMQLVAEYIYPGQGGVAVSRDNKYLATGFRGLWILDLEGDSIYYQDSVRVWAGGFSKDGRRYYCTADQFGPDDNYVYVLDLATLAVSKRYFYDASVVQVIPSSDESLWFLYLFHRTWLYSFAVYDVALDTLIFQHYLEPGMGELLPTPDGSEVFVSNPGGRGALPPAPGTIVVYDVLQNRISREVSTLEIPVDSGPRIVASKFYITPEGGDLLLTEPEWPSRFVHYRLPDWDVVAVPDFGHPAVVFRMNRVTD